MIVNGSALIEVAPLSPMILTKCPSPGGVSHGLSEAGYDITIAQSM